MPAKLRQLQKEYNADLLARVLKAPCPYCGAKPGQPCKSQYRRGNIAGAHWHRTNESKRRGYVQGKVWKDIRHGQEGEEEAHQQGAARRSHR